MGESPHQLNLSLNIITSVVYPKYVHFNKLTLTYLTFGANTLQNKCH